jgi:hypothetical protein
MDESIDLDGDGLADIELTGADLNGDGVPDVIGVQVDLDQDGVADVVAGAADLDGDYVPDAGAISADTGGYGQVDILATSDGVDAVWSGVEPASTPDMEVSDPYDLISATHTEVTFPGAEAYYEVHGTPLADMQLWEEQDSMNSCAIATTNMMFRSVGIDSFTEDELANLFQSEGAYDPARGTDPDRIADTINMAAEAHGLSVHAVDYNGFDIDQLQELLDQGICPLVGVDSSELYDDPGMTYNELFNRPDAGHAVQVTGIVRSSEGEFVILNDPGMPGGAARHVPVDQFLDAAEDCGFKAIALLPSSPEAVAQAATDMPWLGPALVGAGLLGAALTRRRA